MRSSEVSSVTASGTKPCCRNSLSQVSRGKSPVSWVSCATVIRPSASLEQKRVRRSLSWCRPVRVVAPTQVAGPATVLAVDAAVVGVRFEGLVVASGTNTARRRGMCTKAVSIARAGRLGDHVFDRVVHEDGVELLTESHGPHVALVVRQLRVDLARLRQHRRREVDKRERRTASSGARRCARRRSRARARCGRRLPSSLGREGGLLGVFRRPARSTATRAPDHRRIDARSPPDCVRRVARIFGCRFCPVGRFDAPGVPRVGSCREARLKFSSVARNNMAACGRSAAGSASPCQGEGRGFESRRPLGTSTGSHLGGVAERRGNGLQSRVHGFKSRLHLARTNARAIGAVGARFLDTEEVTGSNPVSPTSSEAMTHRWSWPLWLPEGLTSLPGRSWRRAGPWFRRRGAGPGADRAGRPPRHPHASVADE